MAARGILVLCGAVDVILVGNDLARIPHVALLERAPQTVSDHGIDHFAVAHPQPVTNARQQIRAVAHRFHAAGDGDVDVAGADTLVGEHHRFEPGTAHLIDRHCRDVIWQASAERRLTRGVLTLPGCDDVAHDAFVDDGGFDAGAADGFGDNERAELRRGELFQRAQEFASRRTDSADDDGVSHWRGRDVRRSKSARAGLKACTTDGLLS